MLQQNHSQRLQHKQHDGSSYTCFRRCLYRSASSYRWTDRQTRRCCTSPAKEAQSDEVVIIRERVASDCTLLEAVQQLADVDASAAQGLLQLGAVYFGQQFKGQPHLKWRRAVQHHPDPANMQLAAGDWVRVHPRPKRFPACQDTHWPSQVVHQDQDYLVVSKPAGLPSMGHESNSAEQLAPCVAAGLGCGPLQVCHRLDQWTTGIIVLAKNSAALARFHRALEGRAAMTKTYKVLTWRPLPLGPLHHYMYDGPFGEAVDLVKGRPLWPRGPRLLSEQELPGWKECQLEVLSCRPEPAALAWWQQQQHVVPAAGPAAQGCGATTADDGAMAAGGAGAGLVANQVAGVDATCGPGSGTAEVQEEQVYESTVRLVTGRTHQIRAQCSAVGVPLVGDCMYGPIVGQLVGPDAVVGDEVLPALAAVQQLAGPIGLHAWQLEWDGRVLQAPAPWQAAVAPQNL